MIETKKNKSITKMIEQIKERLDIVSFLGPYLRLSPAGKNFKALCPFHKEKTASFIVSPDRQIWHCFGCSKGGDIIKFLMLYENIEFFEALKILAEKAGLDTRQLSGSDQRRFNVLYEINQAARDFFKNNLNAEAKSYLAGRGLTPATIEEFELGFSLSGPDLLTRHLLNKGYRVAEVEQAGLALKTERGTYWDRFRGRIMFPLYNNFGKVVGFTGRILPRPEPVEGPTDLSVSSGLALAKYVNSPETPIFNKSKILFGFHKSKNAIRETRAVILVEGQMDFLMLWQDGVKNVIATSGTALTSEHLAALRRLADTLIINFDSDEAGQIATERAIDLGEQNDFVVKVSVLPEKDAADFVKSHSGAIQAVFANAMPAMEYYFNKYEINVATIGLAEAKNNLRFLLSKVKMMYSPVEQGHWIKEFEKRTGIADQLLWAEMQALKPLAESIPVEENEIGSSVLSRKERISDQLINLAFCKKEFFDELSSQAQYLPESHRQILLAESKNIDEIVLLRASLSPTEKNEARAAAQFKELFRQLRIEYWKEKRQVSASLIREAEKSGNEEALSRALKEFDNINKELQNL